ncbi:hypothetical protein EZV62_015169 [Acer yangbiense]|uniref:WRKY domain-containing protein n=1 Tax=Acer yangbiense TaxID=1000413 RepID=A0A5C7HW95_9ROSI|nr:hypothetical protein EZV62_015169 [Acer yangbiense]
MNYPENPNPNFSYFYHDNINPSNPEIEVSDYLVFDDGFDQEDSSPSQSMVSSEKNGMIKKTKEDQVGHSRVAFRTKSELEVMDDGFKWRKYGKKSVKNSPNPRNYYKCSSGGCNVKKIVERDREDPSYVITTYDGIHNHESPCVVYYNTHVPLMLPPSSPPSASANWAFQNATSHSSSSF